MVLLVSGGTRKEFRGGEERLLVPKLLARGVPHPILPQPLNLHSLSHPGYERQGLEQSYGYWPLSVSQR